MITNSDPTTSEPATTEPPSETVTTTVDPSTSGHSTEAGSTDPQKSAETVPHKSSLLSDIIRDFVAASSKMLAKKGTTEKPAPVSATAPLPLPPVAPPPAADNLMQPMQLPPLGAYCVQPPIAYSANDKSNWKMALGSALVAVLIGKAADLSGMMSHYPMLSLLSEHISSILHINYAIAMGAWLVIFGSYLSYVAYGNYSLKCRIQLGQMPVNPYGYPGPTAPPFYAGCPQNAAFGSGSLYMPYQPSSTAGPSGYPGWNYGNYGSYGYGIVPGRTG